MKTLEWKYSEEFFLWECFDEQDQLLAWISKRNGYCDRGHYLVLLEMPPEAFMDFQDSRPNYYMELSTAMNETDMFIHWRLNKTRIPNPCHTPHDIKMKIF